jgi:hypothetical protein
MKRAFSISIAAAVGLLLSHTAEAQGRFSGGGRGGATFSGGTTRSFGGGAIAGRSMGGHAFMTPGRSFSSVGHFSAPIHSGSFGSAAFVHNPAVFGHGAFHGGFSRPVNSVAFGGRTINGFNRGFAHAPTFATRGWDFGHTHVWNHHHFGWRNGSWVIIDNGFGYPSDYGYPSSYGYPYDYGYPSDYGYASNYGYPPDYAYDYGSDYSTATVPTYRENPNDNSPPSSTNNANTADDLITEVQQALANAGYDPGNIDGELGPQSKSALAKFQREHGLTVTGRITRATLSALGVE